MMQDSETLMKPTLNIIAIGIAAGAVAAILSVGSLVQNALSFILFILSPLPIILAGLGWGPVAAVLSVVACGLSIAFVAGEIPALIIVVVTAMPAALAAYFGGMARVEHDKSEWFPLGLILLFVSLAVATGFVISGLAIGYNAAFVEEFSKEFVKQLASTNAELAANPAATNEFVNFFMASIPHLLPASWLMIMMGNLWLALLIARRSGLLIRPRDNWPDALHLPVYAIPLLVLAVFGAVFSSSFGTAIAAFAGALGMAFVITGFAFIHVHTRGKPWRPAALWLSYASTLTFWAAPLFLFVGLYRSSKNSVSNG
jgi:Predicted membrane protein (DUF2232)